MAAMSFTTKLNLRLLFLFIVILILTSVTQRHSTLFKRANIAQSNSREAINLLFSYTVQLHKTVAALQQTNGAQRSQAIADETRVFGEIFGADSAINQQGENARIRQLADEIRSQHAALLGILEKLQSQQNQSSPGLDSRIDLPVKRIMAALDEMRLYFDEQGREANGLFQKPLHQTSGLSA